MKPIGNKVKPNEIYLHPSSLLLNKNTDNVDIIPTQYYINNNNVITHTQENILDIYNQDFNNYIYTPNLLISENNFLTINNINNIDDLIQFIDKHINNLTKVNRIINCYIKSNYNDLKIHNNILISIYIKLFKLHHNIDINQKKINKLIDKWFLHYNKNSFHTDLYTFLFNNLKISN